MGQYYIAVNLSKEEFLSPHDFDDGVKLIEHSWTGCELMEAAEKLLSPGGRWHGDSIVWAGDYMDNGIFLDAEPKKTSNDNLYSFACNNYRPVKAYSIKPSKNGAGMHIVNHTKKEYVCKAYCPQDNDFGWSIHPLPILVSSGNGRGGGDYTGASIKLAGSWAGDLISIECTPPDGYLEIRPNFQEGMPLMRYLTGDEDTPTHEILDKIKEKNKKEGHGILVKKANILLALSMDSSVVPLPEEVEKKLEKALSTGETAGVSDTALYILCSPMYLKILGLDTGRFFRRLSEESARVNMALNFDESDKKYISRAMAYIIKGLEALIRKDEMETVVMFVKHCLGPGNLKLMSDIDAHSAEAVISGIAGYLLRTKKFSADIEETGNLTLFF
jgi:hypothetical protein